MQTDRSRDDEGARQADAAHHKLAIPDRCRSRKQKLDAFKQVEDQPRHLISIDRLPKMPDNRKYRFLDNGIRT